MLLLTLHIIAEINWQQYQINRSRLILEVLPRMLPKHVIPVSDTILAKTIQTRHGRASNFKGPLNTPDGLHRSAPSLGYECTLVTVHHFFSEQSGASLCQRIPVSLWQKKKKEEKTRTDKFFCVWCVCAHGWVLVSLYAGRPEESLSAFSPLRHGLLLNLKLGWRPANKSQRLPCLPLLPQHRGYRHNHAQLFVCLRDSGPGPQAWAVRALTH